MYKILEIGKKEYKIEFTIEASLYGECTEKVTALMMGLSGTGDADGKKPTKDDVKARNKEIVSTLSDIPQTTLTMFYAGLLEHHGEEEGDGTVTCKADAKRLLKQYMREHKGEDTGYFYGVMELLLEQMEEDVFFDQIGLGQMMKAGQEQAEKKMAVVPQDHKPKATKAAKVTEK